MSSKSDSKMNSFVKLAIFLFVTLLSFSVGIFAGKKFSDNQHELAALEPQKSGHASREVASAKDESHGAKPGAMTDEEIAKLAEEFVADETTPAVTKGHDDEQGDEAHGTEKKDAAEHQEHSVAKTATVTTSHDSDHEVVAKNETQHEASSAAQNLAAGKAPAAAPAAMAHAVKAEDRIPSSLPKEVGGFDVGKFTVQVASYANESEAQKMASDLKGKGYSAFYIPAKISGKTWFRVSVGQFATQKEAQGYRAQFMQKTKVDSAIVQKITE
jgi:cell division septation protein DedD